MRNFCDHSSPYIWPLNSSDSNPFDYNVLCVIEPETKRTSCKTKDEMKARTTVAFINSNMETVENVSKRFQSCLEAVVVANSDLFE